MSDHEADALPQAAGYYRPSMGKHLFHIEKRGPAFEPQPLATELAKSLQAQTVSAIGDLLYALTRRCLSDALPAYERVMTALQLHLTPVTIELRGGDHNARLLEALVLALSATGTDLSAMRWQSVDSIIRAMARNHAAHLLRQVQADEDEYDWCSDLVDRTRREAQRFAAFADGEVA